MQHLPPKITAKMSIIQIFYPELPPTLLFIVTYIPNNKSNNDFSDSKAWQQVALRTIIIGNINIQNVLNITKNDITITWTLILSVDWILVILNCDNPMWKLIAHCMHLNKII